MVSVSGGITDSRDSKVLQIMLSRESCSPHKHTFPTHLNQQTCIHTH